MNIRSRFEAILSVAIDNVFLMIAAATTLYFLLAVGTHSTPYFGKADVFALGMQTILVSGVALYYVGKKIAERNITQERNKYAQYCYNCAKTDFESTDYVAATVAAAKAVGATSGLHQKLDCSFEYHLLALSLDKLHHESATDAHDHSAFYATDSNPNKAAYWLNASLSYFKKKDWEFAILRAQHGLYFIERQPAARFDKTLENYDFGTELRTIMILSSIASIPGTKAFAAYRGDAEWIVENSRNEDKKQFAKSYLSMNGAINDIAKNITNDYLRDGAAQN